MKEIDKEYPESLMNFETDVNTIMAEYGIQEEHAACYNCNFEDKYICKEYNGGCKRYGICEQIKSKRK